MKVTIYKKNDLSEKKIDNICKLKLTFWKYSYNQHMNWFKSKIHNNDLHFCCENSNLLLGYNSLRNQISYTKFKKFNYFLFDTFIIKKNFRNKGLAKKIMNKNISFLRKNKKIAFLQCEKKHIKFYSNLKWKIFKSDKKFININIRHNMQLMFVNFSNKHLFLK
jgi:hypothetical protein